MARRNGSIDAFLRIGYCLLMAISSLKDTAWPFWPLLPLYPYGNRQTLRQEVLRDTLWTFEQLQGILYVAVPIRMSVIRLQAGGLLVYAPIAPTPECIHWVRELETIYGKVKYIVLPTTSGLEHKVFVGPFARYFPDAEVWVAPNQWSFPLPLPLSWLGFPIGRTRVLPANVEDSPFAEEFDYAILGPINLKLGAFVEVALFHRESKTLLLTDMIVAVPENPPAILQLDPYPLLFHARDSAADDIIDTENNRRKGWQRLSLFAFYFRPSAVEPINWKQTFAEARLAGDRSKKNYFGLYPFYWRENWIDSFKALWDHGRPFVAPVLQTLILNRAPSETLAWAEAITQWDFERIIPCHFQAPLTTDKQQFIDSFNFLKNQASLPEADFCLLRQIDHWLARWGI